MVVAAWYLGFFVAFLAVPILAIGWPLFALVIAVKAKRRLYRSPLPARPNRIILALLISCLSIVLYVTLAAFAVIRVNEYSHQVACQEQFRWLGQAVFMYANDHGDEQPPDLCALVRGQYIKPDQLHCPGLPPATPITITPTTTDADLIYANATSYLYLGPIPASSRNAGTPLVIEIPGNHLKALVLFADGHSEALTPQQATLLLQRETVRRATTQPTTSPSR